jgi:hypothetical protein
VHKNLTVYLIHGKDTSHGQEFLTLQEALAKKQVVIKETGNVNQLTAQNLGNLAVFIQGGDIIRGGQQDRTIQYDMVLPPKSGITPINVFCVENGRWEQRGREDSKAFAGSTNGLPSKALKYAAKVAGDQSSVWSNVAKFQSASVSNGAIAAPAAHPAESPTSLELTLDNKPVQALSGPYLKDLQPIVEGKSDVIGYAFAINGTVNSADVYASPRLFKKLWPKLINASAVEASTEANPNKKYDAVPVTKIQACMKDAEGGKSAKSTNLAHSRVSIHESDKNAVVQAIAPALQGATNGSIGPQGADSTYVIHSEYMSK